jgi:hypothetical protein
MCDEYGMRWTDGSRAIKLPLGPFRRPYWIQYDARSGRMDYTNEMPNGGYKHLGDIRPFDHNFSQFIRGKLAIWVKPREIGQFLDLCEDNDLLWYGNIRARAGMKGGHVPTDGMFFLFGAETAWNRRYLTAGISPWFAIGHDVVDFHYIPRSAPRSRPNMFEEPVAFPVQDRSTADGTRVIVIRGTKGSRKVSARMSKDERLRVIAGSEATCSPSGTYSFATGAMLALARLVGEDAWRTGLSEVELAWKPKGKRPNGDEPAVAICLPFPEKAKKRGRPRTVAR